MSKKMRRVEYPQLNPRMLQREETIPMVRMGAGTMEKIRKMRGAIQNCPAIAAMFALADLQEQRGTTIRNDNEKVGRNEPCPCGCGKKFKDHQKAS